MPTTISPGAYVGRSGLWRRLARRQGRGNDGGYRDPWEK